MEEKTGYHIIIKPAKAEIEVKKSRFIARLCTVQSGDEARAFLETVRKEERDARHHCFAMRLGAPGRVLERFSDDGEPQGTAGKPMLELLKGGALYDVCAVVTRYFGGTLLGTGGLVRAYSDALKEALSASDAAALREGVRVSVLCEYGMSQKLKYAAECMGLYTEQEEYTDKCRFFYLLPKEQYEEFAKTVTELSKGAAFAELLENVLYYGTEAPKVYSAKETS